jgi:hypothetical protein
VADELGLPHITWRLLRHWGATQMVEARVPLKAAQERLGTRDPIFFSSSMRMSSTRRRTWQRRRSGVSFGGAISAPMTAHAAD